jgi:hypothetical protein
VWALVREKKQAPGKRREALTRSKRPAKGERRLPEERIKTYRELYVLAIEEKEKI